MLKFIENKTPDYDRVANLLKASADQNHWANRGPVYRSFQNAATAHSNLPSDVVAIPCANGGLALEAQARLLEQDAGRRLQWVVSSFSFRNLGRGFFSSATVLDCNECGLLDLDQVNSRNDQDWDGMVVVNPFGSAGPEMFEPFIERAKSSGKHLLLDNSAGFGTSMPNWPWQAISLHHTKPYGVGEGGLAIVPRERAESLYTLFDYGDLPNPPSAWLNNAKISDISCAFLLDRLETAESWHPNYITQGHRIDQLADRAGLKPLLPMNDTTPCMSRAYLADRPFALGALARAQHVTFGKYYQPVAATPVATDLYRHLINIPTHSDVAGLTDQEIVSDLRRILA